jgi:hypothetical protein
LVRDRLLKYVIVVFTEAWPDVPFVDGADESFEELETVPEKWDAGRQILDSCP